MFEQAGILLNIAKDCWSSFEDGIQINYSVNFSKYQWEFILLTFWSVLKILGG